MLPGRRSAPQVQGQTVWCQIAANFQLLRLLSHSLLLGGKLFLLLCKLLLPLLISILPLLLGRLSLWAPLLGTDKVSVLLVLISPNILQLEVMLPLVDTRQGDKELVGTLVVVLEVG